MNEDILEAIKSRAAEYSEGASLSRNAHMNRWCGPDPTKEESLEYITAFLSKVQEFPGRKGTNFLEHLLSEARVFLGEDVNDERKKAMLVDYINWASFRFYGMDLGLYTSDM